ncbi:hypothetical protein B0H14DRAFT_1207831 [Mycena olivaceomarginata]|nr:hypothetical protein B0H14DRAFT_1207831 [Mycena olivaceomarginata]
MTQWTISEPPVSSLQGNVVGNARDAGTLPGDDLSSAFPAVNSSDYEEVNSPQTQSSQSAVCLDARTLATRYRTPSLTYWDECVRHFVEHVLCGVWKADGSLHVEVMSGVREYSGNMYIASVGTGDNLRLATVVRTVPASIQEVAKEFYDQTRDPLFGRTVYGHRRFIRDTASPLRWQSRFKVTQQSYGGVDFDWVWVPDNDVWLPFHQQLILIMDHNFFNLDVDYQRLIKVLTPVVVRLRDAKFAGRVWLHAPRRSLQTVNR